MTADLGRVSPVDVSVLTTGHDVADARLHRLVTVLIAEGLTVEVHGLGASSGGPVGVPVTVTQRRSLTRRALRAVLLPWQARGRVLLVLDPDLVLPALVRCWLARRRAGAEVACRLVADVHEDYASTLLDRGWATGPRMLVARLVVRSALRAASHADATVVADDHVPPRRPRTRLVVRNVPLPEMLPPPTPPADQPRALYVGDVRRSRGLHSMLALLEACPEWTLDVVGPVALADRRWLAHWRATSPARHRVVFHGRRPPREAWRLASGAWVGLCLLEPTPAFVAALPSKVLEYLACGLTVLATPLPRVEAVLTEAGVGTIAPDLDAAATALRRWSAQPDEVRAAQQLAVAWSAEQLSRPDHYGAFGRLMRWLARTQQERPSCRS